MGSVFHLPSAGRDVAVTSAPEPEITTESVPEPPLRHRAARRPWFQERWRALHLVEPGEDFDTFTPRLHWQLRRRRM